jgi:hypothetical protein
MHGTFETRSKRSGKQSEVIYLNDCEAYQLNLIFQSCIGVIRGFCQPLQSSLVSEVQQKRHTQLWT